MAASRRSPFRGVSLKGLPEGFFLHDLLWFAEDGASEVPIARGFEVVPADPTGLGVAGLAELRHRLKQTLVMLGTSHSMQIRWTLDSDYRRELLDYDRATDAVERELVRKESAGEWMEAEAFQLYHRRALFARQWGAMERGELQRERLHVYVGRTLKLPGGPQTMGVEDYRRQVDTLAGAESRRLWEIFGNRMLTLHPDATVRAMTDNDHFLRAEYFSDPLRPAARGESPLRRFDPGECIGLNCFTRQWGVPSGEPGVTYLEDGVPHALLALLTPPASTYPAEVPTMLRALGFHEMEVILNIRPLDPEKVAARLERESNEAGKVIENRGDQRYGENVRQMDKRARILAYRSGERQPYAVLYTFHLWANSSAELRTRVENLKLAIEGWRGANAMLVTLPGSARHAYANAWPGWWCGGLQDYYNELDDVNVADMVPWSSTFIGEPEGAEAMFEAPSHGLVFVRTTFPNGQPRHYLTIGKTGGGKTTFINDLVTQIRHGFDFIAICESGSSLVVSSALEGVQPLVISARAEETLNPFDPDATPLTDDFFAFLAVFLLGRMGLGGTDGSITEREEVQLRKGILLQNLHALYDQTFRAWTRLSPAGLKQLRRFAIVVQRRHQAARERGMKFGVDEVALDLNAAIEGDDATRQQLALEAVATVSAREEDLFSESPDGTRLLRDLCFMFMPPEEVPTLGRFVAMLDAAPAGDRSQHDTCRRMAGLLRPWCARGGAYGRLFDGVATVRIGGRRFHVETGGIGDGQDDLRDATNTVVAGKCVSHVKRLPRAQRKLFHFPELAEVLNTPTGEDMILLLSTQIRKYNGILGAEIQQLEVLRQSRVQRTVWGNFSQRYWLRQPDPEEARESAQRARLSPPHTQMMQDFPAPGPDGSYFLLNVEGGATGPAVCRPGPVLLYAAESGGRSFDERQAVLAQYPSLALGLITEGENAAQAAADARAAAAETGSFRSPSALASPPEQKLLPGA